MPSTYAHFVFGKRVFHRQPEEIRRLICRHKDLYYIGLHGPDILFYYKPLFANSVNSVGFGQHEKPASEFFLHSLQVLEKARHFAKKRPEAEALPDEMLSYILGFLCHFALDSSCHGYIENKIHISGVTHTEIEVEFDRYLMIKDGLDPIRHKLTEHIHPAMDSAAVIAPFFQGVSSRQVFKALRSMIFYNNLLVAPHEWKRLAIRTILQLTGNYREMHGLMVNGKANPLCADSCIRLEKLMDKAVERCLSLTANLMEAEESGDCLDPYFDKTFGPEAHWRSIPVYSLKEELKYEV